MSANGLGEADEQERLLEGKALTAEALESEVSGVPPDWSPLVRRSESTRRIGGSSMGSEGSSRFSIQVGGSSGSRPESFNQVSHRSVWSAYSLRRHAVGHVSE
jgi:hypothetical protein